MLRVDVGGTRSKLECNVHVRMYICKYVLGGHIQVYACTLGCHIQVYACTVGGHIQYTNSLSTFETIQVCTYTYTYIMYACTYMCVHTHVRMHCIVYV